MNKKITRRIALGTIIAGLATGPFIIRAFRGQQMEMGLLSDFHVLRNRYKEALSFPREYNPIINPRHLGKKSKEVQEKVLAIHKRYWKNFSVLDEVEFDYSSHGYVDGKKQPGNFYMDVHVKLKYGYGLELKGKDAGGKPIHWVFNMDGDVSPIVKKMNLSSMMQSFFQAFEALPEMTRCYADLHAENVDLPENPYIKGEGKYDIIEGGKDRGMAPRVYEHYFSCYCFSRKTGMLELFLQKSVENRYDPKYKDPQVPLPSDDYTYDTFEWDLIDGVYLPSKRAFYRYSGSVCTIDLYSNIRLKLLS